MIKWHNEKKRIEVAEIDDKGNFLINSIIHDDQFDENKHIKEKPPKHLKKPKWDKKNKMWKE
ncbi:hypothetical protein [Tepidibacillus sp. LV47]|uniref:hypothetical protein n=1 Tax=Tepidibacillus sp. LV47 TaxID=3398228 RepID=UPI003AAB3811